MHDTIRPTKIGATGNIKGTGTYDNGYCKLVLEDKDGNKTVIELNEIMITRVLEICLISMKYSDIDYSDIVQNITDMDNTQWQSQ